MTTLAIIVLLTMVFFAGRVSGEKTGYKKGYGKGCSYMRSVIADYNAKKEAKNAC